MQASLPALRASVSRRDAEERTKLLSPNLSGRRESYGEDKFAVMLSNKLPRGFLATDVTEIPIGHGYPRGGLPLMLGGRRAETTCEVFSGERTWTP
jgi:hypothetical protein